MLIRIKFEPNPDLSVCTEAQRQTYEYLRRGLATGRLKVGEVLAALGLSTPAPLISRLDHLQEKGLISWLNSEGTRAA